MHSRRWSGSAAVLLLAGLGACIATPDDRAASLGPGTVAPGQTVSTDADGGVADAGAVAWQPVAAGAAVSKVKNLLVGVPPTDAEIAAVAADPTALRGLVDQWAATPQYSQKMLTFFANSFQQSQVLIEDFSPQAAATGLDSRLLVSLQQMFARTALQLIAEGRPFTETVTTRRFMMTPALMAAYAMMDSMQVSDTGGVTDTALKANPKFQFTIQASQGPIPLSDSLNPASPNYMVFYAPSLATRPTGYPTICPLDPIVYKSQSNWPDPYVALYLFFLGQPPSFNVPNVGVAGTTTCSPPGITGAYNYIEPYDYTAWQMVNIRKPLTGETTTQIWDIPRQRAASELLFNTPRVGFFTTPAFFAGWQTNASNQARVTLNQTLIVALGKAIDLSNTTTPPSLAAVDQVHAAPGTACYGCHQSLDPLKQFFRHDYSLNFGVQTLTSVTNVSPGFAFQGVSSAGSTIFDLANLIATHPRFATAWTQKLCTYANSMVCAEDDPEFIRIANAFAASNYSWPVLVRELFSSPIVTFLADTATVEEAGGELFPLARRDHLCPALSARTGITDVCGLSPSTSVPTNLKVVQTVAAVLPSDQYSRGSESPVLASDPSLMTRSGMENLCAGIAQQLVDNGTTSKYQSKAATAAIADLVHNLMAIGADRDATPLSILTAHFNTALTQKDSTGKAITATDALKSTFVLACLSPSVVGLGQ